MKGILVFSGSGPLLILSSYPTVDHPEFVGKLKAKGLRKFIAYEQRIFLNSSRRSLGEPFVYEEGSDDATRAA